MTPRWAGELTREEERHLWANQAVHQALSNVLLRDRVIFALNWNDIAEETPEHPHSCVLPPFIASTPLLATTPVSTRAPEQPQGSVGEALTEPGVEEKYFSNAKHTWQALVETSEDESSAIVTEPKISTLRTTTGRPRKGNKSKGTKAVTKQYGKTREDQERAPRSKAIAAQRNTKGALLEGTKQLHRAERLLSTHLQHVPAPRSLQQLYHEVSAHTQVSCSQGSGALAVASSKWQSQKVEQLECDIARMSSTLRQGVRGSVEPAAEQHAPIAAEEIQQEACARKALQQVTQKIGVAAQEVLEAVEGWKAEEAELSQHLPADRTTKQKKTGRRKHRERKSNKHRMKSLGRKMLQQKLQLLVRLAALRCPLPLPWYTVWTVTPIALMMTLSSVGWRRLW